MYLSSFEDIGALEWLIILEFSKLYEVTWLSSELDLLWAKTGNLKNSRKLTDDKCRQRPGLDPHLVGAVEEDVEPVPLQICWRRNPG